MECEVQAMGEYPEVSGNKEKSEIYLLQPVYGGKDSETTAIMGYAYQSYVLKEQYPEVSLCLEKIAIIEMKHHELLAKALLFFGGTPYIGGNQSYWQGGFVNYGKNPSLMLQNDILGEKKAIFDYKNVIRQSKNESVKALIERIIRDEEIHINTLTYLQNNL